MRHYKVKLSKKITGLKTHLILRWSAAHMVEIVDGEYRLTEHQLYQLAADHGLVIVEHPHDEASDDADGNDTDGDDTDGDDTDGDDLEEEDADA